MKNPYAAGTKYAYLFDLFTQESVPCYADVLADVSERFPDNPTSFGSLRRFKNELSRMGAKLGVQARKRVGVPSPRVIAEEARSVSKAARLEMARKLLTQLGYTRFAGLL